MSCIAPDIMVFSGAYDPHSGDVNMASMDAMMSRRNHTAAMDPVYGSILHRVEELARRTSELYPIGDEEPYLDAYEQTLFLKDLKDKPGTPGDELLGKPVPEPMDPPQTTAQSFEDERDLQRLFKKLF